MIRCKVKTLFVIFSSVVLSSSLFLGGCASKAKLIQAGAAQFENESLSAIEKIDQFRQKEIAATPLPPEKASAFFVKGIKASSGDISLQALKVLTEPFDTTTPKSEAQWQAFLQQMRHQYTTFAATFASLDTGSVFAASDVKDTIPILDKLIGQMTAFSISIKKNPAEFIRERSAIAANLEKVRDSDSTPEIKELQLLEMERRLREITAVEKQITKETMGQALKAAKLGTELRKLIVKYDQLRIDDISEGLTTAFKLVGGIPGLDLTGLEAETNEIISMINADESLKSFFDTALSQVNGARSST